MMQGWRFATRARRQMGPCFSASTRRHSRLRGHNAVRRASTGKSTMFCNVRGYARLENMSRLKNSSRIYWLLHERGFSPLAPLLAPSQRSSLRERAPQQSYTFSWKHPVSESRASVGGGLLKTYSTTINYLVRSNFNALLRADACMSAVAHPYSLDLSALFRARNSPAVAVLP